MMMSFQLLAVCMCVASGTFVGEKEDVENGEGSASQPGHNMTYKDSTKVLYCDSYCVKCHEGKYIFVSRNQHKAYTEDRSSIFKRIKGDLGFIGRTTWEIMKLQPQILAARAIANAVLPQIRALADECAGVNLFVSSPDSKEIERLEVSDSVHEDDALMKNLGVFKKNMRALFRIDDTECHVYSLWCKSTRPDDALPRDLTELFETTDGLCGGGQGGIESIRRVGPIMSVGLSTSRSNTDGEHLPQQIGSCRTQAGFTTLATPSKPTEYPTTPVVVDPTEPELEKVKELKMVMDRDLEQGVITAPQYEEKKENLIAEESAKLDPEV